MDDVVERLRLLAAESRLGLVDPEMAIERAAALLTDLPANAELADLAGAEASRELVSELVASALEREGSGTPDAEEAGRLVARWVCRSIVQGEIKPIDGARSIWWNVVRQVPNLEGELGHFIGLASEWEDDEDRRDDSDADILKAAEAFQRA